MTHASGIVAVGWPVRFWSDLTVCVERKADRSQEERNVMSHAQPSLECHKKSNRATSMVRQRNWDDRDCNRDKTDTRDLRLRLRNLRPAFARAIAVTCIYPCDRIANPLPMPAAGYNPGFRGCLPSLDLRRSASSISSIATWTIWLEGCTTPLRFGCLRR